ncbi:MAG: putative viral replication protein [Circoviridae sp.]|nr:MAG: putative viral replication protein [Circoviridae sp.]
MSARKGWCFTLNNYTEENIQQLRDLYDPDNEHSLFSYLIFGKEVGEQGTPHLQGFVFLSTRKRFNWIHTKLPGGCHIEGANGTPHQNRTYCSKDGAFEEFGDCPGGQGARTDLASACELVRDGKRLRDLVDTHPTVVVKYYRGLSVLRGLRCREPRPKPFVTVYWGEPGAGKTYGSRSLAQSLFETGEIYNHRGGKWWQDYDGEKCIVHDDFTGASISVATWCRLFNTEPFCVETKGGSAWCEFTHAILTSNSPPSLWWRVCAVRKRAALRRIDRCVFIGYPNDSQRTYDSAVWTIHQPGLIPPQAFTYVQGLEPPQLGGPFVGPIQHITGDNI